MNSKNTPNMLELLTVVYAMRSPPITASASESIISLAEKMITNDIGAIVVTEDEAPIGLITERDIVESIIKWYDNPSEKTARDIMSTPIIKVEKDETIRGAFEVMRNKGIRRLGVTENGRIIGIVTERRLLDYVRDILKLIAENM